MPLSPEYASLVRDVVVAQLEDSGHGFNFQFALTAAAAGVPAFVIDWSATSFNFFEAQIDPVDIEGSTPMKYPIVTLATLSEDNTLREAFVTFSGSVSMELAIYLSFRKSGVPRNVEATMNAVTAALVRTFCDPGAASTANFTGPVTYNRRISVKRTRLQTGAENWRAALKAYFTFDLDTF
jgi:hypothetical protein